MNNFITIERKTGKSNIAVPKDKTPEQFFRDTFDKVSVSSTNTEAKLVKGDNFLKAFIKTVDSGLVELSLKLN
jgi:hypothetical protein